MSLGLTNKIQLIQRRAFLIEAARTFFKERGCIEVDTPLLVSYPPNDAHIQIVKASALGNTRYLISSPEYAMKRLLAEGAPDIYQISHVFRDGELGTKHSPEFTMAEWYRKNFSLDEMIEETCAFIALFIGKVPYKKISFKEIFETHLGINPFSTSHQTLLSIFNKNDIALPSSFSYDDLLLLLLERLIEPKLEKDTLTVLYGYPASMAACAITKKDIDGNTTALRFEVYYQGLELANGYQECNDKQELEKRFQQYNLSRQEAGYAPYEVDPRFLEALKKMPACSGVACGFDRLVMLNTQSTSIEEVLCFAFDAI